MVPFRNLGRRSSNGLVDQVGDLFTTLTERRYLDGENIEAVVQILSKCSVLECALDLHIRGCKDAHIDLAAFPRAQSGKLTVLQHVQKLGLHLRSHLANFIQEEESRDSPVQTCRACL